MTNKGTLLLLPNLLGKGVDIHNSLPQGVADAVAQLDGIIAESAPGGRSFLMKFATKKKPHDMPLAVFNKNTDDSELNFLLEPLARGEQWGYISDAGLPCIADPGDKLVKKARDKGYTIRAYPGPSSIFLALMLSGLPGQHFSFNGYIAQDQEQRKKEISEMETISRKKKATQIFIEAPYRNIHTFQAMIETLAEDTLVCVAWDLTMPTENVLCKTITQWRRGDLPDIAKIPAIFLIYGR